MIVGAGGLGCAAALYLAANGVGSIGLADADRVEISNLHRQVLYNEPSIGKLKTEEAKAKLQQAYPDCEVSVYPSFLDSSTIDKAIEGYDIVLDASDNFPTRYVVNDACYRLRIPLVSAAVSEFKGQLTTYKPYLRGDTYPCYRCFCPELPDESQAPQCSDGGVLGTAVGVLATLQATETVKELLSIGESLAGAMLFYDALRGDFRKVRLRRDHACALCSTEQMVRNA